MTTDLNCESHRPVASVSGRPACPANPISRPWAPPPMTNRLKRRIAHGLLLAYTSCTLNTALGDPPRIELPEIGDPTATSFTSLQEHELGEQFYRSLHAAMSINADPEIADYIQGLGQRLSANSDKPDQPFHFFVVDSPVINAFAGPGGYIGVNSGLILTSEAESELASVMAHEIAHITQRHLFQTFQEAGRLALPTALAMLAAALVGARAGGQAGQAAMIAAQAAGQQHQINFTRDNEAEADRVGMHILSKSSFDPRSMPTFFERMQQSTRFSGAAGIPEFLLTHPVTTSRISDTRDRAEKFAFRQYPDSMIYQLVRAKLRVQAHRNPNDAVGYFRTISGQGTAEQQDVARYGLALSLIANRQPQDAQQLLLPLIRRYPNQPLFVNALAHAQLEAKDFKAAAKTFAEGLQRFPENRAMVLEYVRTLLTDHRPDEARQVLQSYSAHHAPTPDVFELFAEINSQLGRPADSHRFVAEAYQASGQTRAAIQQLLLARAAAGSDRYVLAIIEERLDQLREEERERRER